MTLVNVPLPENERPLPRRVARLLEDADHRIATFHQTHRDSPVAGFVNSDFATAWRVLDSVVRADVAPGVAFCEWGSGFGVITLLAASLGLDAIGIEINADLVDEADDLATANDIDATFVLGNFVPTDGQAWADATDSFDASGGHDAWMELGIEPDDIDIVYVFPWPDEVPLIEKLFDQYAQVGAILITCRGIDGMHVQRKDD